MISNEQLGGRLLVVFDGQCGMCNGLVRGLINLDRHDRLRFATSDSLVAAALLSRHSLALETLGNTIVVALAFAAAEEKVLQQSSAVAAILRTLPQPWPLGAVAIDWLPAWLSNLGYRLVARNRYRIWGQLANCPIPTVAERGRFL